MQARSILILISTVILIVGCGTLDMQPKGRSGTEQLMTALSIQQSLNQLELEPFLKEKTVAVNVKGHSDEIDYIKTVMPAYISRWNAKPVINDATPDLTLTVVVDAAGTDVAKGGVVIPILLPSITSGITLTNIDVGTVTEQWNTCRLWVYISNQKGNVVYTSDPSYEGLWIKNFNLLGLSIGRVKNFSESQQTQNEM